MTTKPSYTPTLRFPDFLNDGEWEVKRLGEIITVNSGRDYKHLQSGDIPVYGTGGYMLSVNDKLSDIDAIGIGRKGTIDKPQYLKAPFWTVDTLFFLTTKEGYDLIFVFCLLQTVEWKKYSEQTGVPSLTRSTIEKIEVKIPPFSEQRRIAQALTALDELIAATNGKLEQMKAYKKGLMQKLFPARGKKLPELRFKEFEKDGEWEEKELGAVAKVKSGYAFRSNTYTQTGRYKIITISNVKNGYLDLTSNNFVEHLPEDIQPHQILQKGDILISMTGNVGRVCKVYCDNCLLNQRVGLVDVYSSDVDKNFIYTILTSDRFEKSMIENGQGAAQANIGNKDIEGYCFFCPPTLQEQRKVADCFTSIDEMINQYTNKVSFWEVYKKGLMQQMFPTLK